jgi:aminobenzoyl-glutamate utilization protein B
VDDEEREFAREIRATLTPNDLQNSLKNIAATGGEAGKAFARRHQETLLVDEVAPYAITDNVLAGSTDVGDVSWKMPVAQCFSPCFTVGTPLHTWQLVAQGRTSIAQRHAAGRESDGRDRAESAAGRGAAEKMP